MCAFHRCSVLVWAMVRSRNWIPKGADFSWKSTFWPALFETLNIPTLQKKIDIFTNCANIQKLLMVKFNPSAAGNASTTDSSASQMSLALHRTLSILGSNPASLASTDSDPLQIQTYVWRSNAMPLIVLILGSLFLLHVNMPDYLSGHDDYSSFE